MGMALKRDVLQACRDAGTAKPIDLAFLSTQTMGDSMLENEILGLFISQSKTLLDQVAASSTLEETGRLAHTIKGVARSIGAFRLADFAEKCEQDNQIDEAALRSELQAVCAYIAELQDTRS